MPLQNFGTFKIVLEVNILPNIRGNFGWGRSCKKIMSVRAITRNTLTVRAARGAPRQGRAKAT